MFFNRAKYQATRNDTLELQVTFRKKECLEQNKYEAIRKKCIKLFQHYTSLEEDVSQEAMAYFKLIASVISKKYL